MKLTPAVLTVRTRYDIAVQPNNVLLVRLAFASNYLFSLLQPDNFEEDVPFSKIIEQKRSAIKLKPRSKPVLEPRADKFSPDPLKKPGKKVVRRARKPAVVESDDDREEGNDDAYVLQPREKMPSRRGGKANKRGRM